MVIIVDMSVICHEDGEVIHTADQAFSAATETSAIYVALCNRHLDSIPLDQRLSYQIDGGLDIHDLFGRPNGYSADANVDTLSIKTMELGNRRFSISRSMAQTVLPKCTATFL